jgi:hypothetical protein
MRSSKFNLADRNDYSAVYVTFDCRWFEINSCCVCKRQSTSASFLFVPLFVSDFDRFFLARNAKHYGMILLFSIID